jgi:antitoxin VapB
MSMNIKSPEAHELATELARLRGVTVTKAVTDALQRYLEQERKRRSRNGLAAELVRIGKRCAAHVTVPTLSSDHGHMLYDEHGLPR